jgi:hypothetical protein
MNDCKSAKVTLGSDLEVRSDPGVRSEARSGQPSRVHTRARTQPMLKMAFCTESMLAQFGSVLNKASETQIWPVSAQTQPSRVHTRARTQPMLKMAFCTESMLAQFGSVLNPGFWTRIHQILEIPTFVNLDVFNTIGDK